jgi:hypothetical protein
LRGFVPPSTVILTEGKDLPAKPLLDNGLPAFEEAPCAKMLSGGSE